MFERLGHFVSTQWKWILTAWFAVLVAVVSTSPPWEDVVQDGDFAFLPADAPSRLAEETFAAAFPDDLLSSSVVVVVRRPSRPDGLTDEDRDFIRDVLYPRIAELTGVPVRGTDAEPESETVGPVMSGKSANDPAESSDPPESAGQTSDNADAQRSEETPRKAESERNHNESGAGESSTLTTGPDDAIDPASSAATPETPHGVHDGDSIVIDIRYFDDKSLGSLLNSPDGKASLLILDLATEFQENRNAPLIEKIEVFLADLQREHRPDNVSRPLVPVGLDLTISGTATAGRDLRRAAKQSGSATESWTIILVVALLLLIYRAPLLALIPLLTVAVSTAITRHILATMASFELVGLFDGIEVYVTVVVYGAGVDYCLFLVARYKEELDGGATIEESIERSLAKVGAALVASAGTVICGIGMMVFAQFGKFQQAGVAITLGLFVCLCAALTLTPACLRLAGRWAFWPNVRSEHPEIRAGWISPTSLIASLRDNDLMHLAWTRVGQALQEQPRRIWLMTIALMLPFAIIGVIWHDYLSYGLLSELPRDQPSVIGASAIQQHFPAGITGPVTVLLRSENIDFSDPRSRKGPRAIEQLMVGLHENRDHLGLAGTRSLTSPLGRDPETQAADEAADQDNSVIRLLKKGGNLSVARAYYVSKVDEHVTRLDLIYRNDPFSRDSIANYVRTQEMLPQLLPPELAGAELQYVGATPSIFDLKQVTDSDQIRIDLLVMVGVFLILVVLLRRPAISAYLIISVFFSYLATLGVTITVFYLMDPAEFAGLDWKVPMFLFTILIAVGEDYNIFLMTRVDEESRRFGPIGGVTTALERTGGTISSCGVIMAGTFSSLLAGTLLGMHQLGFALAFGVLLDTFVVRPILVPAWLILLHRGEFGRLGSLLGARREEPRRELVAVED